MSLKLRRGTDSERLTITPQQGEVIYVTDTKRVFVGDGTTTGGIPVGLTNANAVFASVVVNGNTTTQHLIPSANITYDLGSPTAQFRDLYLSGNTLVLGGTTVSATNGILSLPEGTIIGGITANLELYAFSNVVNTVYQTTNSAFDEANSAFNQANSSFDEANSATALAQSAFDEANSAFNQANSSFDVANLAFNQANVATTLAQDAYDYANTIVVPSLDGYATESYVTTAISNVVNSAPELLDTLNELAAAIGDDANFVTTINSSVNSAFDQANSAFGEANVATALAQSAYDYANTIVSDTQIDPLARSISNSAFDAVNAIVTFSGNYEDLSNKPNQDLNTTNDVTFANGTFDKITINNVPSSSTDATTKSYVDSLYSAGTGLNLNGVEFSLANTTVNAGTYGDSGNVAQIVIDDQGRITSAANVVSGGITTGKAIAMAIVFG